MFDKASFCSIIIYKHHKVDTIMGKIIDPDQEDGVTMFLNANIKNFLATHTNESSKATKSFKNNFYNDDIQMHIGSLTSDNMQVIAVNQEGKKMYYNLAIDENLQVSSIAKVSKDQLSQESQEFIENLNSENSPGLTRQ